MTVPAAAAVGTDKVTVAPAATIATAIVAIIVGTVAIPAAIAIPDSAASDSAAGGNDHEQAGKSCGR
jgi:hypothetical protein